LDINPYKKFFLLIDEYHILFNQYVFRDKAVRTLLEIAPKFIEKTYMSATSLKDENILEELMYMPVQEVI